MQNFIYFSDSDTDTKILCEMLAITFNTSSKVRYDFIEGEIYLHTNQGLYASNETISNTHYEEVMHDIIDDMNIGRIAEIPNKFSFHKVATMKI